MSLPDSIRDQFWEVFETTANPMLVVNDERIYTQANEAACRLLRRRRGDIIGRRLDELTAPRYVAEVEAAWCELLGRRLVVGSWALIDTDGKEIPVQLAAAADAPEPGRHLAVFLVGSADTPQPAPGRLTPREREITRLLAHGVTAEAIARELYLSVGTVRTHIRNAMEHVGAHTRAQLTAVATRDGLIDDPRGAPATRR